MLDDFFIRALLAGIGVAILAGPLGCFVVWRRMAYFGDTLSHAALLGVALAVLLELPITPVIFILAAIIGLALLNLQGRTGLSWDSMLGLLSHVALALGLVVFGLLDSVRVNLTGFLFGDILAVSRSDLLLIALVGSAVLIVLALIWRTLFASTVNRELAEAEGMNPTRTDRIFMILLAVTIALSMQLLGVLLTTSMLIIPAATARRFAVTPEQMAVLAALIGTLSVVLGLTASWWWDSPSGPSIVVAAGVLFVASLPFRRRL